jgi:hypothetical protein
MAVRGNRPVLKFRGKARAYLRDLLHYCIVVENYDAKRPLNPLFTAVEEAATIGPLVIQCRQKLAQQIFI